MSMKVVVGVDAREGDQDAVAFARAVMPAAELILVNAYPFDSALSRFLLIGYGNALRDDAETAVREVRARAGVEDARIELVPDSSPARALQHAAEGAHAALLVVASAHRGPIGRTLLGDVSRSVLHGAPCPVAVAPRGWSGPLRRIGVAFDGSPEAHAALDWAVARAAELGAAVRLRQAVLAPAAPTSMALYTGDVTELEDELRERAQAGIDEALAGLDPAIDASGEAATGPPDAVLDLFATDCDVVVTGSRGWGTLRRVVLGSTSDRLIHHAPCPVVVMPRGAEIDAHERTRAEAAAGAP
jgi:nucleotide-binding universal stress UspA family protein